MIRRYGLALLGLIFWAIPLLAAGADAKAPLVLAAASLQDSLTAEADAWAVRGHLRPVISFAASSALARQIESGAPADLFISADEQWMDDVASKGFIRLDSRSNVAKNALVLIAPTASKTKLKIGKNFNLARELGTARLAMADPDSVPAGKYGKAALISLGVWNAVASKIARAENVRAALALVERGEVPFGIVYATDALATPNVRVIGTFPSNTHAPITYPMAILKASTSADADAFRKFLVSKLGQKILIRFGFAGK